MKLSTTVVWWYDVTVLCLYGIVLLLAFFKTLEALVTFLLWWWG
jgi:hypothetical protein